MNAFVGVDITCAVLASGMTNVPGPTLLCDIGTNGEIALWKNGTLYVTSTAAGPAFEGGDISCGMRATDGAVEACTIDIQTMEPTLSIIGEAGQKCVGICGSGIIDIISELERMGDFMINISQSLQRTYVVAK